MNLQLNTHYSNKTWRFLFPCLRAHGEEFMEKIATISIMAVGVGCGQLDESPNLYILYNKEFKQEALYSLLAYLHKEGLLVESFSYDKDIRDGLQTMLVVKLPEEFHEAYQHFINGYYSQMFSIEQIEELFAYKLWFPETSILGKEDESGKKFLQKVNEEYGSTVKFGDIQHWEYESPIVLKEEVFNYDRT